MFVDLSADTKTNHYPCFIFKSFEILEYAVLFFTLKVETRKSFTTGTDKHQKGFSQLPTNVSWFWAFLLYFTGVGLALTVDTVRLVHPLLLVQINTRKDSVNFPPMSPNFVQFEPGWKGKNWVNMQLMSSLLLPINCRQPYFL